MTRVHGNSMLLLKCFPRSGFQVAMPLTNEHYLFHDCIRLGNGTNWVVSHLVRTILNLVDHCVSRVKPPVIA